MCVDRKSVGSANSAFEAVDEGEALRSVLLCSRREVEISWMRLSWRLTTLGIRNTWSFSLFFMFSFVFGRVFWLWLFPGFLGFSVQFFLYASEMYFQ